MEKEGESVYWREKRHYSHRGIIFYYTILVFPSIFRALSTVRKESPNKPFFSIPCVNKCPLQLTLSPICISWLYVHMYSLFAICNAFL